MRNRKSNLLALEHRLSQLERRIKNEDFDDDDMDDVDNIISGEVYALVITSTMTDVDYYFISDNRSTITKCSDAIINSFFYDDLEDEVIMLDRICKDNNIIQINSEDDPYAVMEADDYCDIHDCDDDMFEDDDQLVYVDDLDVTHPLNIVKHIHERF